MITEKQFLAILMIGFVFFIFAVYFIQKKTNSYLLTVLVFPLTIGIVWALFVFYAAVK